MVLPSEPNWTTTWNIFPPRDVDFATAAANQPFSPWYWCHGRERGRCCCCEPLFENVLFCKTHFVTQALHFGWFITQPPLRSLKPSAHLPEAIRQKSREKQSMVSQTGPLWGAEGAAPAVNFCLIFISASFADHICREKGTEFTVVRLSLLRCTLWLTKRNSKDKIDSSGKIVVPSQGKGVGILFKSELLL